MTIILWIVVAVLKFMLSIIIDYNYNITYRIQNIYRFFEGFEEEKILVGRWLRRFVYLLEVQF